MRIDKALLLIWQLTLIVLWLVALKRHWAERVYDRGRHPSLMWFWLDTFHIPRTRQNCVRLLKYGWTSVIALSVPATLLILFWGR